MPDYLRAVDSSSRSLHDGRNDNRGGGGGEDMLEARVAKLEADVENIKTNLSEARLDIRDMKNTTSDTSRDVGIILQKLVDFDEKLSKKPNLDQIDTKIANIKWWFLTVLLFSIAMPVITLLINLYLKKP